MTSGCTWRRPRYDASIVQALFAAAASEPQALDGQVGSMSLATHVRGMQDEDLLAVARLSEDAFRDTYRFDWQANAQALLDASRAGRVDVCVAERDDAVVGYCNLRAWPIGGWIDQIVVARDQRQKGIGRALLEATVVAARRRGYWKLSLVVSSVDAGALTFFRACGWDLVGTMTDEIARGIDGLLLSRIVDHALHPNPSGRPTSG